MFYFWSIYKNAKGFLMKKYFKIQYWLISLMMLLFIACSDKNEIVTDYSSKIATTDEIFITFEKTARNEEDISFLHSHSSKDNAIKLNGKALECTYSFATDHKLLIMPDHFLEPNTHYTLEVNLANLEQSSLKDKIKLSLHTNPTHFDYTFTHFYDKSGFNTLEAQIEFSQRIDFEKLANSISLKNTESKNIDFELIPTSSTSVAIKSAPIKATEREEDYKLTLETKHIGLEKKEVLHYVFAGKPDLEITKIQAIPDINPSIEIDFSQEIQSDNLKDFVLIEPDVKAKISKSYNKLIINAPFDRLQTYTLTLVEGIKASDGSKLKSNFTQDIVFTQIPPSIAFSQQGVFLPTNADKKISFKSMNVKKVKIKISRIYPNNITAYLYDNNLIGNKSYKDDGYYDGIYANFHRLGDEILQEEFDISFKPNQWVQNSFDLSNLPYNEGIFIVELSFDENGVDYTFPDGTSSWRKSRFFNESRIQKHLVFSNIALIAQQINDKTEVLALDIAENKPLSSVNVQAISFKNQILAQDHTDNQGIAVLKTSESIMYLSATKDNNTTILKLNAPLSNDGFDVSGQSIQTNTNAYIYTDRGVYRPGDTAHINVIARANNKPTTHPIYLTLISPQGKEIVEKTALTDPLHGLYYYGFNIDKDAPTGLWKAKIQVGDSEFWHHLSVETIVPNRIKVLIQSQDSIEMDKEDQLIYGIQSHYLFGAKAANLRYETNLQIVPTHFYSQIFTGYTFTHPSSLNYSFSDSHKGQLDSEGLAQDTFNLQNVENLNKNLRAYLDIKVFESGGRSVGARKVIDLNLYDSFVGLKAPQTRYVDINSTIQIPVIALSNDGKTLISNRNLQYKIYQNSYSWWWDYDNYNEFIRSIKTDRNTTLVKEGQILSQDKPVMLEYQPKSPGETLIEVEDSVNGAKSAVFLYVSQYGEPIEASKIQSLKTQSNKPNYLVGEEATISFESMAHSKALITLVDNEKVLERFWVDTKEKQTSFKIPIKKSYAPNIYVIINLLQNYTSVDNDRSQRLYGVVPLMVEDAQTKLTLEINAPKSIQPNEDFTITLSNKEHKKVAYTLAVVDEGLLDLTDFISPNPWKYFYQKIALALSSFDNFNDIIGKDIGTINQILKIGGDEAGAGAKRKKDFNEAERFKPVALYKTPAMSDEKGNATIKWKIPTYIGNVRIMAVAINENAYGSTSRDMKVTLPVVMLPTIPRSLKLGDRFSLAVEVLPTESNIGKVDISIKSGDKITFNQKSQSLRFISKDAQSVIFDAQVSKDSIGTEEIILNLTSPKFKTQEKTSIDIKPNNPYTTINKKFTIEPQNQITLSNPKDFVQNSQSGYLVLSQKPMMSIDHRLRWLIRYPYGCIEQTTSSVLPQLYLTSLSSADFIDKPSIVKNINAGIARIGNFQTSDGGFAYWQGGSQADKWGSNYAGHFLLLAKEEGYYVPQDLLNRWIRYQINFVKNHNTLSDINTKVYSLYLLSLAKEPQIGLLNQVYEKNFDDLSTNDKWLLAAAYKLAGVENIVEKITKNLSTRVIASDNPTYYHYNYGSPLRDEAMILKAYTDIYKNSPKSTQQDQFKSLLSRIQTSLESNDWLSTQTLGYSLLALASTSNTRNDKTDSKIQVKLDGKTFESDDLRLKIPFSATKGDLESKNTTTLYVNQVWDGILLNDNIKASSSKITLTQEFLNQNGEKIDVSSLPSGSTFWIKLSVDNEHKPVEVDNLAVTQNIPSGWEIENTRLNNDILPFFVKQSGIAYTDIRDDKIMWFFHFYGERKSVFVKINTVTPGEYILPPATAEAMYDNSFLANTQSSRVKVTSGVAQ